MELIESTKLFLETYQVIPIVTILAAVFALYSIIQNSKLNKKHDKDAETQRKREQFKDAPFHVCLSDTLYRFNDKWMGNNLGINYVDRKLSVKQDKFFKKLGFGNVLLYARAGMGKTREAIEHIIRLGDENGEPYTVLRPTSDIREYFELELDEYTNNAILFIDDIDQKIFDYKRKVIELGEKDEQPDYLILLDRVIKRLEGSFDKVTLIFTSRKESKGNFNWNDIVNPDCYFWELYSISFIPLPDIKENKEEFIKEVTRTLNIRLDEKVVSVIFSNWDGTCKAITDGLKKVSNKVMKNTLVENDEPVLVDLEAITNVIGELTFTYPLDIRDYFEKLGLLKSDIHKEILLFVTILNSFRVPIWTDFIKSLVYSNANIIKRFFYKRNFRGAVNELEGWLFPYRDELIFQSVYASQISFQTNLENEKLLFWRLLKDNIGVFNQSKIDRFYQALPHIISIIKEQKHYIVLLIDVLEVLIKEREQQQFLKFAAQLNFHNSNLTSAKDLIELYLKYYQDDYDAFIFYIKLNECLSGCGYAIEVINKSAHKESPKVAFYLAKLQTKQKQFSKAILNFEKLHKSEPSNYMIIMCLAITKERLLFKDKIQVLKNINPHRQELLEIEELYNLAITLNPDIPSSWHNAMVFFAKIDAPEKSKLYLERFLARNFDEQTVYPVLGKLSNLFLKLDKNWSISSAFFVTEKSCELYEHASDWLYLTRFSLSLYGNNQQAKTYLKKGLLAKDFEYQTLENTLNTILREKKYSLVINIILDLDLENTPHYERCKKLLAAAYFQLKEYDKAQDIYEDLLTFPVGKSFGFIPRLLRIYAYHSSYEKIDKILVDFSKGESWEGKYVTLFEQLCYGFYEVNDFENVLLYAACIEEEKLKKSAREYLKIAYNAQSKQGKINELLEFPYRYEVIKGFRSIYLKNIATLAFKSKHRELVVNAYKKNEYNNMNGQDWWRLSVCLNDTGEYEDSINACTRGIEIAENDLEASNLHRSCSYAYFKLKKYEASLNEIIKIRPKFIKKQDEKKRSEIEKKILKLTA